ncbi:MAG: cytochrome c1 [Hyphomicrobiales bacterium]|nr:cytochrome c1 [Hyphomicrobiales bacterium]
MKRSLSLGLIVAGLAGALTVSAMAEDAAKAAAPAAHEAAAPAEEGGGHSQPQPPRNDWSFAGVFGHYDQAQLQRGFRVFREVCSNCHSANLLAFRNLSEPGGPEFSEAQVKALAAEYKVKELSDKTGDIEERPARPSDHWPAPFANEIKAREANGGALPPDMSVLAKARSFHKPFPFFIFDALPGLSYQEHGVDYITAIMNGYRDEKPHGAKADDTLAAGQSWNEYMPGYKIGMPKPLSDGAVDYTDGTPKTVDQYAKDVSAFLMWTAEPKLEQRKKTGMRALIFLLVLSGLLYATKKRIWSNVPH